MNFSILIYWHQMLQLYYEHLLDVTERKGKRRYNFFL